jgi:uncharacterized membrane-anchored protein
MASPIVALIWAPPARRPEAPGAGSTKLPKAGISVRRHFNFNYAGKHMTSRAEVSTSGTVSKVAEVTIYFWIMKVLATTLGETFGDFISMTLGLGYYAGLGITFAILAVILFFQISARSFHPALFWAAIIATTTVGTEVSDFMDRSLGLGYALGSLVLIAGLAAVLGYWYYRDRDLSVYPIVERKTEIMFWLAVLFSNSLGTAFGDFLVDDAGLTFIQGALVTAGVIGVVAALHYFTKLNSVLLFWIAFVFTRPFGATFGDFLTKPIADGGLNIPREFASLLTLALLAIVLFVSTRMARRNGVSWRRKY